jgi:hypothetical protein
MYWKPRRDNTFLTTICASFVGSLTVLAVVLRTVEAWIGNHGLDPPQFRGLPVVIRLAENDFIESHKGAEGLPILVRRGLHLKYLDSRKQADLDWPSFVDEV